jgi:hypothetical protein
LVDRSSPTITPDPSGGVPFGTLLLFAALVPGSGTVALSRSEMYDQNCIRICITWSIILIMAVLFLLPAIDNGFPFIFPDSGVYLGGVGLTHIPEHEPIYYVWFTRILDLPIFLRSSNGQIQLKGWSPWPSVVLQSLITAWMIWLLPVQVGQVHEMFYTGGSRQGSIA